MDALGEGQEPEGDEGRDRRREADPALPHDGLHGAPDASRYFLRKLYSLRDLSEGWAPGLLSISSESVRIQAPLWECKMNISKDNGREFVIGGKIFTLQRNLVDNGWDVDLPTFGWWSTGFQKEYSSAQAEEAFRLNFKGGAKKFIQRRRAARE